VNENLKWARSLLGAFLVLAVDVLLRNVTKAMVGREKRQTTGEYGMAVAGGLFTAMYLNAAFLTLLIGMNLKGDWSVNSLILGVNFVFRGFRRGEEEGVIRGGSVTSTAKAVGSRSSSGGQQVHLSYSDLFFDVRNVFTNGFQFGRGEHVELVRCCLCARKVAFSESGSLVPQVKILFYQL
jgi:hypothetical protein